MNNTVFVDPQFGNNATAQRENEALPYLTLSAALAAAVPADTIYVQPGTFNEGNLQLRNTVDWYFTEGSRINYTGSGFIFLDGGTSVTVVVQGFGSFSAVDGVLQLTGSTSNVLFTALDATISGSATAIMFSYGCAGSSQLHITCWRTLSLLNSTGSLLYRNTSSNFDSSLSALEVSAVGGRFIGMPTTTATGTLVVRVSHKATGGSASGNFVLLQHSAVVVSLFISQLVLDNTTSTGIIVSPPSGSTTNLTCQFLDVRCLSGSFLSCTGTTSRTANVGVVVQHLSCTMNAGLPIVLSQTVNLTLRVGLLEALIGSSSAETALVVAVNSTLNLQAQAVRSTEIKPLLSATAADVDATCNVCSLVHAVLVSSSAGTLAYTSQETTTNTNGRANQTIFDLSAQRSLVSINSLRCTGNGVQTSVPVISLSPLINVVQIGEFLLNITGGPIAFLSPANTEAYLTCGTVTSVQLDTNSRLLQTSGGAVFLTAQQLEVHGGIAIEAGVSDTDVTLNIGTLNAFDGAMAINAYPAENSRVSGYLASIFCTPAVSTGQSGYVIRTTSFIYLTVDHIATQGALTGFGTDAAILQLQSELELHCGVFQVSNFAAAFEVTVFSDSNFRLMLERLEAVSCQNVFLFHNGANSNVSIENLQCDDLQNALFLWPDNGTHSIAGSQWIVNATGTFAGNNGIFTPRGTAAVSASITNLTATTTLPVLNSNSNNTVSFVGHSWNLTYSGALTAAFALMQVVAGTLQLSLENVTASTQAGLFTAGTASTVSLSGNRWFIRSPASTFGGNGVLQVRSATLYADLAFIDCRLDIPLLYMDGASNTTFSGTRWDLFETGSPSPGGTRGILSLHNSSSVSARVDFVNVDASQVISFPVVFAQTSGSLWFKCVQATFDTSADTATAMFLLLGGLYTVGGHLTTNGEVVLQRNNGTLRVLSSTLVSAINCIAGGGIVTIEPSSANKLAAVGILPLNALFVDPAVQ